LSYTQIKGQITLNEKFILLASNNGIASKWCNWEIGYADPFKLGQKKLALLPLADDNGTWSGNEYLQIYPRIEGFGTNLSNYAVLYPNGTSESLAAWLIRK
jgi:hypothetical protein